MAENNEKVGAGRFEQMLADSHRTWVEGLREQLKVPADWTYYRTPRATDEAIDHLLTLIGVDNFRIASGNNFGGGTSVSIFISPAGMAAIKAATSPPVSTPTPATSPIDEPSSGLIRNNKGE